jgi:tRNA A-37 threonylcarbamoyl transferase component Bud32
MFSHFLRKIGSLGLGVGSPGHMVRSGGRRWHLTPEGAELFGNDGPDLDRWIADGTAVIVKTGPHRTVYRVALPDATIYVKHCRIMGPRAWAREVLRPAKARLEFENAVTLAGRGIAAVQSLAWGETDSPWPGESFLITRSLDSADPFTTFLEDQTSSIAADCRAAIGRRLATELGRFFAHLHDAGIAHQDPHPGNFLLEFSPPGEPRFSLIDVHAICIGRPLSWAESRTNLVLFNRWFQIRVSRADRARFWHSYRQSRKTLPNLGAAQAREVETGTAMSNLRFWAGRVRRCLGSNRYFRKLRSGAVRGHAVVDLPAGIRAQILDDPDSLFRQPGVKILKDSRTSKVAEVCLETADGPREAVLKRVNVRNWFEPIKNRLRPSAALRSWVSGHALRDRWLPTPRPLAMVQVPRLGLPATGYLLVEKVPDAIGLAEAVAGLASRSDAERRQLLRAWSDRLARMVRTMHDRAVSHRDLKAANILLKDAAADPEAAIPVLIDLVGVRVGRRVSFRQRCRELARINASFLNSPLITRGERLRFLLAYLAAGERPTVGWKAWWKEIRRATRAKIAKNRRTGRPLA